MDANTFQAEAEKYERLMFQISWSMLRNSEDCADAVQDALIKAWQKRDTLHDEERFKPWLMRILHNTCKDMLRRRKKVRFVSYEEQTLTVQPPEVPIPVDEAIERLQRSILAISQREEPFDVFICYKETDNNGRRTVDSTLAQDIYYQLTNEGYKVFFSRITLEDKLGTEYEPYIFSALNSAKVMLVIGTSKDYFNAVWVKNEWARFLDLARKDKSKMIIPCYRDMDAYDLPDELSMFQSQDMSKIGFIQDLIRGIKKVLQKETPQNATVVNNTAEAFNSEAILKRAFMLLEDAEWQKADELLERILNQNPECAEAYLGKLMIDLKVNKRENLATVNEPFIKYNNNYQKIMRYCDDALRDEMMKAYTNSVTMKKQIVREEKVAIAWGIFFLIIFFLFVFIAAK